MANSLAVAGPNSKYSLHGARPAGFFAHVVPWDYLADWMFFLAASCCEVININCHQGRFSVAAVFCLRE